ncbi:MAG TPA: response regulator transcription factor [Cyclobacteriaceae bacterium]|jgi:DNA-binding NarL/FixJ family response regulator
MRESRFNYNTLDRRTRIVIIEDNEQIREGYALILNTNSNYNVVSTYNKCEKALKYLHKDNPAIVFMDIELPGMDGIRGIKEIKKLRPDIDIVVISVYDENDKIFDALCAGASGYITKSSNHMELLHAVDQVLKNGAPMSSNIARKVVQSFQRNYNTPLSARETQVLSFLASGATYQSISRDLEIGLETVKTHVKHIYTKLQVSSKTEALELAKKGNYI